MVERREKCEVLAPGQPPIERALLTAHQADRRTNAPRFMHYIIPCYTGAPRRGQQRGAEHLDQGRLAGTVLPEDTKQLTLGDL
jgi:hypothetical protein